jgi:hypothetical protein
MMKPSSAFTMEALPSVSVFMSPFRVEGTAGADITVDARIENLPAPPGSPQLFAFQIGLLFDPNVVSCTSVIEGGFLSKNGSDTVLSFPGSINNTIGIVYFYGWILTDTAKAKSGSGILTKFGFHMKVTGYSDLHIAAFSGVDQTGVGEVPVKNIDYFTAVVNSVQYIVKIEGNAKGSLSAYGGYSAHAVNPIDIIEDSTRYRGELSFNASGYTTNGDAFAYFNVTVPKALMSCDDPNQWLVKLDDVTQSTRTVGGNATHSVISLEFTYDDANPVKTVKIWSTTLVPEFSSVFFATLLVLATLAAAIFGRTTWSAKRKG